MCLVPALRNGPSDSRNRKLRTHVTQHMPISARVPGLLHPAWLTRQMLRAASMSHLPCNTAGPGEEPGIEARRQAAPVLARPLPTSGLRCPVRWNQSGSDAKSRRPGTGIQDRSFRSWTQVCGLTAPVRMLKVLFWPGEAAHACGPSTQDAQAGGLP